MNKTDVVHYQSGKKSIEELIILWTTNQNGFYEYASKWLTKDKGYWENVLYPIMVAGLGAIQFKPYGKPKSN